MNNNQEGGGGLEFNILVLEDSFSELRELIWPDIRAGHSAVIGSLGVLGFWVQFFPTNLVSLMHVTHVLRVVVAT